MPPKTTTPTSSMRETPASQGATPSTSTVCVAETDWAATEKKMTTIVPKA